ncbi:MAG: hypothetical protein IPO01_19595 [Chitinophagaceae bacterium]|nr:hypothetical protein [Chitinophagaceae bacterium]
MDRRKVQKDDGGGCTVTGSVYLHSKVLPLYNTSCKVLPAWRYCCKPGLQ